MPARRDFPGASRAMCHLLDCAHVCAHTMSIERKPGERPKWTIGAPIAAVATVAATARAIP